VTQRRPPAFLRRSHAEVGGLEEVLGRRAVRGEGGHSDGGPGRRRVALSWCAPGGDPSLVELTLDDAEDGRTRMVVVEVC
jgi:hypothetical protein